MSTSVSSNATSVEQQHSYKLISFHTYDSKVKNEEDEEEDNSPKNKYKQKKNTDEYVVQMFGLNEKGQTASIMVNGYTPFFYIKVGKHWKQSHVAGYKAQILQDMGTYYEDCIIETKLVEKKTLYGFDAGLLHKFVYISFKSESAMRKAKNFWYDS